VRALLAALLLARAAAASDCSTPLAFQPIPDLHVHVGFPVNYMARLNRYCSTWGFRKVTAPPEFDLDGAGGLFYWTPAVTGIETITIEATEGNQTGRATFNAYVDPVIGDFDGDGLVDVAVGITDASYGVDGTCRARTTTSTTPGRCSATTSGAPASTRRPRPTGR